jgi:hypothetical protein
LLAVFFFFFFFFKKKKEKREGSISRSLCIQLIENEALKSKISEVYIYF